MENATKPWGSYTLPASAMVLQAIVKTGISRGAVSRLLRKIWVGKLPDLIDLEVRGIKYRLDVKRNTTDSKILFSSKIYDEKELNFLKPEPHSGELVFVDIGANTGYYTIFMATNGFSKVYSIEPNPPTLELLKNNIDINDLKHKVTIIPLCVGEGGKIPFYCDGGLGGASVTEITGVAPIMVDSAPLDQIMKKYSVTKIDAMKIDVEGVEDKVLIPFFNTTEVSIWPQKIVIEDCHKSSWEIDVISFLLKKG